MALAIGDICRLVLSYYHPAGSIGQNVFFYEVQDDTPDEQDVMDDMKTFFLASWITNWASLSDNQCYCFLMEWDIVNGLGEVVNNLGDEIIASFGSGTGEVSPPGVAAYLQSETERAGSLAKKYVPFIAEGMITDGHLTTGALVHVANLLLNLGSPITVGITATMVPGILSRVTQSFQEITGTTYATNVPAYQRRRKPNVGS